MDFLKQNIIPIVFGVLLLGGIFVYMNYFANPVSPAALTTSSGDASLAQQQVVILQNLHNIKLDNSIFSDPAYQSLTDFGVTIPPQVPGKRNPFSPIVGGGTGAGSVNISLPKTK